LIILFYFYLSPGDLTNEDIADDLEWLLKVISGTVNGFIVCISNIQHIQCTESITTVGRHMAPL